MATVKIVDKYVSVDVVVGNSVMTLRKLKASVMYPGYQVRLEAGAVPNLEGDNNAEIVCHDDHEYAVRADSRLTLR